MKSKHFKYVLFAFILWKIYLILAQVIAVYFVPIPQEGLFLGGGFLRQWASPYFLPWANFDGEHYLSIAKYGYKHLEQAFFPAYPLLMRAISSPFGLDEKNLSIVGYLISNLSLFGSLVIFWKLIRLDYSPKLADYAVISILVFPTAFYFSAVYTESFYLFLSLLTFYFARRDNWFLAGLAGAIASGTRVFGILLFPALVLEAWQRKATIKKYFWIILIPMGLLIYSFYLKQVFGDPFLYYNLQSTIGEQHQKGIILLPQVLFRYIKILLTLDPKNVIYQTIVLEFIVGIVFTLLPIVAYLKKIRLSYVFYLVTGFLLPTVQGSFSSSPRYVLVLFPAFITISLIVSKFPRWARVAYLTVSLIWLAVETIMFLRGYWVA